MWGPIQVIKANHLPPLASNMETLHFRANSSRGNLAPRNIYTRSHRDPDPPEVVNDLESLIKKKNLREILESNNPILRSHSLPEIFPTLEDIDSDLSFEFSLFRTKSESFVL